MNRIALITSSIAWGVLGGFRGVQDESFARKKKQDILNKTLEEYQKMNPTLYKHEVVRLEREIKAASNPTLYVDKVGNFVYGGVVYVNPILLLITISKEIYRLEVNLRGLEEEKHSDRYNKLF